MFVYVAALPLALFNKVYFYSVTAIFFFFREHMITGIFPEHFYNRVEVPGMNNDAILSCLSNGVKNHQKIKNKY